MCLNDDTTESSIVLFLFDKPYFYVDENELVSFENPVWVYPKENILNHPTLTI